MTSTPQDNTIPEEEFMSKDTTKSKVELDDATAADQYLYLTNQAGLRLSELSGGASDAVPTKASVDELRLIAERAAALADYYDGQDLPDDPSLTRLEDLPEETQKRIRADEKAKGEANRALYEAQGLDPDVPVSDPQPPESKEAKVTSPDTRASEGLTPQQARAQQAQAAASERTK